MNKTVKRATLVLALTPLISIPAVTAYADTTTPLTTSPTTATVTKTVTTTVAKAPASSRSGSSSGSSGTGSATSSSTDAPSSAASASAAKLDGIIAVSDTSSTSGSSKTGAHSDALSLGGNTVVGGDATTDGKAQGGNLVGTGDTPLGDVEVLPWSAVASQGDSASKAQAEAALAHAGLLGVLQLWLLHSQSQTTWNADESAGSASTDGFEANLDNQLDVKVLHADAASNGNKSSALLVVNDQQFFTSDDASSLCTLDAEPLASILCLQASGGKGTTLAKVADVNVGGPGGLNGLVNGATSAGGQVAATPVATSVHHARVPKTTPQGTLPHTSGPSATRLPFTGGETGLLALYGAVLAGLGTAITTVARRRRPAAVTA